MAARRRGDGFWLRAALVGAALLFALAEPLWLGVLKTLEHRAQDALLRLQMQRRAPDPGIVLLNIDDHSIDAMQAEFGRFPWPRSVYAGAIEGIAQQQPLAIVIDVVLAERDRAEGADDDAWFYETVLATPHVYLPAVWLADAADQDVGLDLAAHGEALGFRRGPGADPAAQIPMLLPVQAVAEARRTGLINFLEDEDGVGRRYHVWLEHDGWLLPSMPARVATDLGWDVPDAPAIEINWRGIPQERAQASFSDVFYDLQRRERERPLDEFTGKVVIIGATAAGLHDLRPTPVSAQHWGHDILASALETLRNGDALQRPRPAVAALQGLLLTGLIALAFAAGLGPLRAGIALALLGGGSVAAAVQALPADWLLQVVTPLTPAALLFVALSLADYVAERNRRAHAVATFSRFLHPKVVEDLVASGADLLGAPPQSRDVTLLFSDIRGFTTLSETRTPEQIVTLLNRYFTTQVEVVFRHGGTVDKFIGDAIMAFWGAPTNDPQHARHAVAAAIEMAHASRSFAAEVAAEGVDFDIGIGLHSGPAVVAFMGSPNHQSYTAIGDTVNLASRIEGQTKGVARVLVSEATRALCGDDFEFIDKGEVQVKGRAQKVRLFEPRERTAPAGNG